MNVVVDTVVRTIHRSKVVVLRTVYLDFVVLRPVRGHSATEIHKQVIETDYFFFAPSHASPTHWVIATLFFQLLVHEKTTSSNLPHMTSSPQNHCTFIFNHGSIAPPLRCKTSIVRLGVSGSTFLDPSISHHEEQCSFERQFDR